jgi:thioredoxin reductase (NADPH)
MQSTASNFVITREDIASEAVTIHTEGLRIGQLPDSDIWLNHPTASRLHAGINKVEEDFYLINLSATGATKLNNREIPFNEAEVLEAGDEIQIGPYSLDIEGIEKATGTLRIKVALQFAFNIGEREPRHTAEAKKQLPAKSQVASSSEGVNALKIFWGKRTREKAVRPSPLHPRTAPRVGKARFNWTPTRDLVPPWPKSIITWTVLVVALLSLIVGLRFPEFFSPQNANQDRGSYPVSDVPHGMLPYRLLLYGTGGALLVLLIFATARAMRDVVRQRRALMELSPPERDEKDQRVQLLKELSEKYDPDGPDYPHPVIIAERCIGCRACVDACPHDVLAMVNNIAVSVANDQCMEDTACQVVCPVSPKACIVVNTTKIIMPRPAPNRDATFMTNVPGCYLIGDVSGQPLIKNAVNEGVAAIYNIASHLDHDSSLSPQIAFDVAIIGAGPAGLSAAMMAKQRGMKYVVLEQDKVLSTVAKYPRGKYIFLLPELMQMYGSLAVRGHGITREELLKFWARAIRDNGLVIHENESCKVVKKADDGDYFIVQTEKGWEKEMTTYRARRVVLAIGNAGMPMKLKVPGEEIGIKRDGITEYKVKYKLSNPEDYRGRKIIVVGAGNAAVEAAIDLVARRDGDRIEFLPPDESNEVTLVIRSDLTNDLKFANKMHLYDCIDEGKIKVFFGASLKEIRENEVVLMNLRTRAERAIIANDYIFALIGGERPTKFLQSIGITIPFS